MAGLAGYVPIMVKPYFFTLHLVNGWLGSRCSTGLRGEVLGGVYASLEPEQSKSPRS